MSSGAKTYHDTNMMPNKSKPEITAQNITDAADHTAAYISPLNNYHATI